MRRIEHGAHTALSPDTRKSSPVPYRPRWLVPGYPITCALIGGDR